MWDGPATCSVVQRFTLKMEEKEEIFYAKSNGDTKDFLNFQNNFGAIFGSWKEERQELERKLDVLINSFRSSIEKGVNNLIEEVDGLQGQLSLLTQERNGLLETVSFLSNEIGQLREQILIARPLQDDEQDKMGDSQEVDMIQAGISDTEYQGEEGPNDNHQKGLHEEEHEDCDDELYEAISDQSVLLHNEYNSLKDQGLISDTTCNEMSQMTDAEVMKIELDQSQIPESQKVDSLELDVSDIEEHGGESHRVNSEKGDKEEDEDGQEELEDYKEIAGSSIDEIHLKDQEYIYDKPGDLEPDNEMTALGAVNIDEIKKVPKKENSGPYQEKKESIALSTKYVKMGNKKFKCKQCPYATATMSHIKEHVESVHEKIKKYFCECSYATYRKSTLENHKRNIHNQKMSKNVKIVKQNYPALNNPKPVTFRYMV